MGLDFLLTLIVVIIVLGLIYWAVHRLAGAFGVPPPIVTIIDVLLVVIFVIYLLNVFGLLDRIRG